MSTARRELEQREQVITLLMSEKKQALASLRQHGITLGQNMDVRVNPTQPFWKIVIPRDEFIEINVIVGDMHLRCKLHVLGAQIQFHLEHSI